MYKNILFDLDGTLTQSAEGICKCVQYALDKLGKSYPENWHELECFVGPPLHEMFMKYADLTFEEAEKAVEYYRERFQDIGIFENRPYDGVEDMLRTLKQHGYQLGVASSKPEVYVNRILEHFNLNSFFDVVVGSELDGRRTDKAEVIEEALHRFGIGEDRTSVILVGDKEHDCYGAKKAGIDCLAVSYGYAGEGELEAASPLKIVDTVEAVTDFFA
ncbi:MAG: HAD-IA family hydrolase [Eubacteriales bacterium]|nr:HAD-IA family hydrolase [Eubacteriales bacterium]